MKAVSALDVARAALMEVGLEPTRVWESPDTVIPGRLALHVRSGDDVAKKAVRLAVIATRGPDSLVRCDSCCHGWTILVHSTVPCTPVRDVLRGVTCGRVA